VPATRLAYEAPADFIPGVEPYAVATTIDSRAAAEGVQMILRFDRMHDELWTQRSLAGRESELVRLSRLLQSPKRERHLSHQPMNSEVQRERRDDAETSGYISAQDPAAL
jgi:hypothetical protein